MKLTKETLREVVDHHVGKTSPFSAPESLDPEEAKKIEAEVLRIRDALFDIMWDMISNVMIPIIEKDIDPNKRNPLTAVLLSPIISQIGKYTAIIYNEAMSIYYNQC